jgi:hypothetical protein
MGCPHQWEASGGVLISSPLIYKISLDHFEALPSSNQLEVALALDKVRNGAPLGFQGDHLVQGRENHCTQSSNLTPGAQKMLLGDQEKIYLSPCYTVPPFTSLVGSPVLPVPNPLQRTESKSSKTKATPSRGNQCERRNPQGQTVSFYYGGHLVVTAGPCALLGKVMYSVHSV